MQQQLEVEQRGRQWNCWWLDNLNSGIKPHSAVCDHCWQFLRPLQQQWRLLRCTGHRCEGRGTAHLHNMYQTEGASPPLPPELAMASAGQMGLQLSSKHDACNDLQGHACRTLQACRKAVHLHTGRSFSCIEESWWCGADGLRKTATRAPPHATGLASSQQECNTSMDSHLIKLAVHSKRCGSISQLPVPERWPVQGLT